MTTTSTFEPLWVFDKAVLVHAPAFDVACVARLRIAHDRNDDQGSISIRMNAVLTEHWKQSLMLNIRPEVVDMCTVIPSSNEKLFPDRMFSMVPVSVTNAAAVSTLVLSLNTTGVVLVPPSCAPFGRVTLDPVDPHDATFSAFARICQSKTIHLHLSKQQFNADDLGRLRTFSGALCARMLTAQPFDYKRLNAGRGAMETDWRVFEQAIDPPPYCDPAKSVLGKRARDGSPLKKPGPTPIASCSPPPPPWSPTEVNTPTTRSSSPLHISPTNFTRRARSRVWEMQQKLIGLPDSLVREVLAGSGHTHLLAPVPQSDCEKSSQEKDDDTNQAPTSAVCTTEAISEAAIAAKIDKIIEQRLNKLTRDAFDSLTKTRIDALVEAQLPLAADLLLNGAVASYRDQFYEDCKANEANLQEQIEEGTTEVRDVTNECTREFSELAQQCMDNLDEHSRKLDASAEDELSRLKRWFAELAQSFFDKSAITPSQAGSRRVSM